MPDIRAGDFEAGAPRRIEYRCRGRGASVTRVRLCQRKGRQCRGSFRVGGGTIEAAVFMKFVVRRLTGAQPVVARSIDATVVPDFIVGQIRPAKWMIHGPVKTAVIDDKHRNVPFESAFCQLNEFVHACSFLSRSEGPGSGPVMSRRALADPSRDPRSLRISDARRETMDSPRREYGSAPWGAGGSRWAH